MKTVTVNLTRVADKGVAMGRSEEGKNIFLPFGAPGDIVRARLTKEKKRFAEGFIEEILTPSPKRRAPRCRHFTRCGGCSWQHLEYQTQLAGKAASFEGFTRSRLGIPPAEAEGIFLPPIPSPLEYGYRNRATLQISGDRVGFALPSSHRIFSLEECPVLSPAVEKRAVTAAQNPHLLKGLERLLLQVDSEGKCWAVATGRIDASKKVELLAALDLEALYLGDGTNKPAIIAGDAGRMTFAGEDGVEVKVTPGGFVQANEGVNSALRELVKRLSAHYTGEEVLDLYSGAGNFTLPMAKAAKRVRAVEGYSPAVEDLILSAKEMKLDNIEALSSPVEVFLSKGETSALPRPSFVLIDPPRAGAPGLAPKIFSLGPQTILYTSCSPPTLIRDIAAFREEGYHLSGVGAADMFPQTAHLEAFALLTRTSVDSGELLTSGSQSG